MEVVVAAWFPYRRNIYDENRHIKYNYVSVWSSSVKIMECLRKSQNASLLSTTIKIKLF